MAAGTINTIVGSGTLITFPTLLAFGYAPVVANVSNTIGLVPGSISGAVGYRTELKGQGGRALRLGIASGLGGLTGGLLLLVLPPAAFKDIVPALIALACVLVLAQPAISRRMAKRPVRRIPHPDGGPALLAGVFGTGVYGGYFGAAQGVMLLGVMGLALPDALQRINGLKNILAAIINGVAAMLFLFAAHIAWRPALLLAAGSIIGGQIGAKAGRRLPAVALRVIIVVVGVVAIVRLV